MARSKAESTPSASGIPVYCAYDELVDPAALVPNPRNPNRHPAQQIQLLAKIIRHQGWRAPITVSNRSGFIVRGHGRLEAARILGVDRVPVDRQDYRTEADEWADLVADNRLNELAEMDDGALRQLLADLGAAGADLELAGFDSEAVDQLLAEAEIIDLEDLLREVDMGQAVAQPLWIVVRAGAEMRGPLEEAAGLLERRGIRVERSYEK